MIVFNIIFLFHLCSLPRHSVPAKTCVEPDLSLVIAGRSKLLKVSLDKLPTTAAVLPFSAHASGAIALAVDVLTGAYFWTDVTKDSIVK